MIMFAASACLAGLLESLRTAHGVALLRVAALAAPVSAAYIWCLGDHDFGAGFFHALLAGVLSAEAGALIGLVIVFHVETRRRTQAFGR